MSMKGFILVITILAAITFGIALKDRFNDYIDYKTMEKLKEHKANGKPAYCSLWEER